MKDPYSSVAPFYSFLVNLVFGSGLREAKLSNLGNRNLGKILIIGGGDGKDYKHLKLPMNGDFWEKSEAMLELAKKNLTNSGLNFHLGDFSKSDAKDYEEIWLHFVLDTLENDELADFLQTCRSKLSSDGKVYFADFYPPVSRWQKLVHGIMISFFRVSTGYQRKEVPDYDRFFTKIGFAKAKEKTLKKGWIRSSVLEIKD